MQDQNIIPMIRSAHVSVRNDTDLVIDAVVCCQNPTLNPAQLCAAVEKYLPQFKPDFSKSSRLEILDQNEKIFR